MTHDEMVSSDGTTVVFRPIRPEDAGAGRTVGLDLTNVAESSEHRRARARTHMAAAVDGWR